MMSAHAYGDVNLECVDDAIQKNLWVARSMAEPSDRS